eukprot:Awhi_evm1s5233
MRSILILLLCIINSIIVIGQEPIDCVCGEFTLGSCSATCGQGTQTNMRVCTPGNEFGSPCPSDTEVLDCNLGDCPVEPVDCICGDFTLGSCSATCGQGTQTNTRVCTPGNEFGLACPSDTEVVNCNLGDCPVEPVDCVCGDFTLGACSATCGQGNEFGLACPSETEVLSCNLGNCPVEPVDCVCGDFTLGSCSATCGQGTQTNTRVCTPGNEFGLACPSETEVLNCNLGDCPVEPVDCVCGDFTLGSCSATCGQGDCPVEPVDCVCGDFTLGSCSATCGQGTQTNKRVCTPGNEFGLACPPDTEVVDCDLGDCPVEPVDCVCGDFTLGACSATCGQGTQTNTRVCTPGNEFGSCSATCGQGTQTNTRVCTPGNEFGLACPSDTEVVDCNLGTCPEEPIDCVCGDFTLGSCSATCGQGTQTNTRVCTPGNEFGLACPSDTEVVECNLGNCPVEPVDCVCGGFTLGSCSTTCGQGTQTNTRVCTPGNEFVCTPGNEFGLACPSDTEVIDCNLGDCPVEPVDCTCGDFTLGSCSATCGQGTQTNTRVCTPGNEFGLACPSDTEVVNCNLGTCPEEPIDCVCGDFTLGSCSATCGQGTQINTRVCTPGNEFGLACPPDTKVESCNLGICPISSSSSLAPFTSSSVSSSSTGTLVSSVFSSSTISSTPITSTDSSSVTDTITLSVPPVVPSSSTTSSNPSISASISSTLIRTSSILSSSSSISTISSPSSISSSLSASSSSIQETTSSSSSISTNSPPSSVSVSSTSIQETTSTSIVDSSSSSFVPSPSSDLKEDAVDCYCLGWSNLTTCGTCEEGGQLFQERQCFEAINGGQTCESLGLNLTSRLFDCNAINGCPLSDLCSCEDWAQLAPCSESCGGGEIRYSRNCPPNITSTNSCPDETILSCNAFLCNDTAGTATDNSDDGLGTGAIVGIVVIVVLILVALGLCVGYYFINKREKHNKVASGKLGKPAADDEIANQVDQWRAELENNNSDGHLHAVA